MKKLLALLIVVLLGIALVGCGDIRRPLYQGNDYYTQAEVDELIQNAIDELGEEIENEIPQQYYSKDEVEQLIQEQIDELDIEIMYGEYAGRDGDYILVNVNDTVYTTSHISDETIYWGSDMVVIRIGDVYLSYVDRGE